MPSKLKKCPHLCAFLLAVGDVEMPGEYGPATPAVGDGDPPRVGKGRDALPPDPADELEDATGGKAPGDGVRGIAIGEIPRRGDTPPTGVTQNGV
jgi:hypothetical protein